MLIHFGGDGDGGAGAGGGGSGSGSGGGSGGGGSGGTIVRGYLSNWNTRHFQATSSSS